MMNKHKTHSGDRIHSKEAMDLLVRVFQALKDLKVSKTNSGKVKDRVNNLLVTFLMNLRRCLDKMVDQEAVVNRSPRVKTLC